MSFIRCVLGDIKPENMGLTYSHEHIIIDESFPTLANKDFILNDIKKISQELAGFYELGGRTMVDTMPSDCGRNVLKLAEVSRNSKVNIVVPTGIHLEIYYPADHWRYQLTADQMAQLFIDDVNIGIDKNDYGCPIVERTEHKAGIIKLATGDEKIDSHQEKVFEAAVNAHLETGAPILTHTNNGLQAIGQVELFTRLGANLKHVVLSHVDRNKDLGYHKELMQTGVYVEYDSHFRWKNEDENWTYTLLEKLLPDYSNQIVLGMDMAKSSYWKSFDGSPGLNYLLTTFMRGLEKRGLAGFSKKMFIENPRSLYTFDKGINK